MSNKLFSLSQRNGPKPETTSTIPHLQLTENSSESLYQELADWLFSLENVEERRSRASLPSTRAAWISDSYLEVNSFAEREFTHIHTEPGPGSQHTVLPKDVANEVFLKGWGENHPVSDQIPYYTLVLLYAPRNREDIEVIKSILLQAYEFVLDTNYQYS